MRVAHVEILLVGVRKRETEDEKIKEDEERYIHREIDRQRDRKIERCGTPPTATSTVSTSITCCCYR